MDEETNSLHFSPNVPENENIDDNDVQFVEPNVSVICIDDTVEMTSSQTNDAVPLVKIQFKTQQIYQKLQKAISNALQAVFQEHLPNQPVKIEPGKDGYSMEINETDVPTDVDALDSLFVIDSTPMKNKKNDGPIPSYRKSLNKVFDGQTPPSASNSLSRRPKAKQTCWNCAGDHALKDCKEPRDYMRIRQKKEEFQKKSDRYHVDQEQRFGHYVPGSLSLDLRNALGLGPRDLPLHVYKMRVFGYPPGWLEDAKITHSGLQLFGSNGDVIQHSDDSDGEVDNVRMKYDVRKIIPYPGFNQSPPPEMFDDSKFFNVPPYTEELGLDSMIRRLEGTLVGGYRRKKMKMSVEPAAEGNVDSTANMELIDMDAMEGSPEIMANYPRNEPPKEEELEDGELSSDDDTNQKVDESVILIENPVEVITLDDTVSVIPEATPPSPSLADLQHKQNQLVEQLANNSTLTDECSFMNDILLAERLAAEADTSAVSLPGTMDPPSLPGILPSPVEPLRPPTPPRPPSEPNGSMPACGSSERPPEPDTFDLGEIAMNKVPYIDEPGDVGLKRMSLGTPILSAFTPYTTLPSGEAFSKGVSDVIHFENLPNSTGKYLQMKCLLSNVRLKMHDHLRETEDGS
ncbi:zinc finger CCHC domain-containing protein 8 homolog [Anopheles funestus]|uniref:zinc finger CCHC domain-containing protein 8 homolog n=1 Tax=Anopheles funestus TaxID=62324 RepID=UPI0020C5FADD|nr:zinc finger CCHC domain-containing protein 8 homolog [Anopheles funestus]